MKTVYLAGPDVFLENAAEVLAKKAKVVRAHGMIPLSPLDTALSDAGEIYAANIELIQRCDAVLANVSPFHGTEPDSGTVFEIGYAKALNKIIVTYSNPVFSSYKQRIEEFLDKYPAEGSDFLPEPFGLKQNLMISKAVAVETEFFEVAVDALKMLLR